jgi:hypothetical protein
MVFDDKHWATSKHAVSYETEYNCDRNIQFLSKFDNKPYDSQ